MVRFRCAHVARRAACCGQDQRRTGLSGPTAGTVVKGDTGKPDVGWRAARSRWSRASPPPSAFATPAWNSSRWRCFRKRRRRWSCPAPLAGRVQPNPNPPRRTSSAPARATPSRRPLGVICGGKCRQLPKVNPQAPAWALHATNSEGRRPQHANTPLCRRRNSHAMRECLLARPNQSTRSATAWAITCQAAPSACVTTPCAKHAQFHRSRPGGSGLARPGLARWPDALVWSVCRLTRTRRAATQRVCVQLAHLVVHHF